MSRGHASTNQTFFAGEALNRGQTQEMRNALVPGSGRGNFPREILIETIAETGVRQNIVERSSEIC